jgi:hypothetical protein
VKNFTTRQLRDTTVNAIIAEAKKRGAHAAPVFNRLGQIEEVPLLMILCRDTRLRCPRWSGGVG